MQIEFPIEFLVHGTPVSLQAARAEAREQWKERVKAASRSVIPAPHFATESRISVTLFYLPAEPMAGDLDNIVKLILDALSRHIFIDDHQVERILVQKFEPGYGYEFKVTSPLFGEALEGDKPVLYVRISNDPMEELV